MWARLVKGTSRMLYCGGGAYIIVAGLAFLSSASAQTLPFTPIEITSPEIQAGARFGFDVALGDFNGDRHQDLAVSANEQTTGGVFKHGKIWVFWGPDHVNTSSVLPKRLLQPASGGSEQWFGSEIIAEDIDKDGFDDMVVSALRADVRTAALTGAVEVGAIYIFYGPSFLRQKKISPPVGTPLGRFGSFIFVADADMDGNLDISCGQPFANNGPNLGVGNAHIIFGPDFTRIRTFKGSTNDLAFSSTATFLDDLDGDGKMDFLVGANEETYSGLSKAGRVYWTEFPFSSWSYINYPSPDAEGRFGRNIVSGDFNGDGNKELVIAAYTEDVGGELKAGALYVFSPPDYTSSGRFTRIGADGTDGDGPDEYAVSLHATDLDGDGYEDLVVGVEFSDYDEGGGNVDSGSWIWYKGGPLGLQVGLYEEYFEPTPESGATFGFKIDALGKPDEVLQMTTYIHLVVSAIDADVGGQGEAGRVIIYK